MMFLSVDPRAVRAQSAPMEAGSILLGLACTLGVFAVAVVLVWLTYRGVEYQLRSGRQGNLASIFCVTLVMSANAALHIGDADRWRLCFYVAGALIGIFMTSREWRRERA